MLAELIGCCSQHARPLWPGPCAAVPVPAFLFLCPPCHSLFSPLLSHSPLSAARRM